MNVMVEGFGSIKYAMAAERGVGKAMFSSDNS